MPENVAVTLTMALTMLAVLSMSFMVAWRRMLQTPVRPGAWGYVLKAPKHVTAWMQDYRPD
jgi:hypothetical protein